MTEAQKQAVAAAASHTDLKGSYTATASSVRGVKPAAKKKKGAVKKLALPRHVAQGDAKYFIPPTTFIWRNCARGGWYTHCPPNSCMPESFDKHGGCSDVAFKFTLCRVWAQLAEETGPRQPMFVRLTGCSAPLELSVGLRFDVVLWGFHFSRSDQGRSPSDVDNV